MYACRIACKSHFKLLHSYKLIKGYYFDNEKTFIYNIKQCQTGKSELNHGIVLICENKPRIMKTAQMIQLMRLCYLSHKRPANAQASLRICAVSTEPSPFAHMKYGSRRRGRPKIRHLAQLGGCICAFEE